MKEPGSSADAYGFQGLSFFGKDQNYSAIHALLRISQAKNRMLPDGVVAINGYLREPP